MVYFLSEPRSNLTYDPAPGANKERYLYPMPTSQYDVMMMSSHLDRGQSLQHPLALRNQVHGRATSPVSVGLSHVRNCSNVDLIESDYRLYMYTYEHLSCSYIVVVGLFTYVGSC